MVQSILDAAVCEVVKCFSWQSGQAHMAAVPEQTSQRACAEDAQRWKLKASVDGTFGSWAGSCKDSAAVSVVVV